MASPANPDDIEARWRPLTSAEVEVAETRLEDAWRKLKRMVPGIESRIAASEPDLEDSVIQVLADAVTRVLQFNALASNGQRKGVVSLDDASRSWELDDSIRAGLYFTDEEIDGLIVPGGVTRKVFSVMPS